MQKGDIVYGRKYSDAKHPIVFIEDYDSDFFIGAMLTSSDKFVDNIPLQPHFIEKYDENKHPYEFQYKGTRIVKAKLLKKKEWIPFRKIGKLTDVGLNFVLTILETEPAKLWEE